MVRVEEAPHAELVLSGGWGSYDHARAGIDLATRNAFGRGEILRAGADANERGFGVRAEAAFPVPGRRALRFNLASVTESRKEDSYSVDYTGIMPSISCRVLPRLWGRNAELRLGLRYDSRLTTDVAAGVPEGDLLAYRNLLPTIHLMADGRDSRSNPTRGVLLSCALEGSFKGLRSDVSYTRFNSLLSGYVPLHRNVVLALSNRWGVIKPQEDTVEIPVALRFFAGGIGSVRGIPDRGLGPLTAGGLPMGGEALATFQAELRFRIWKNVFGAAFVDRGDVFADARDFRFEDTRYCLGWGLRYLTQAGFIVLDVGYNRDRRPGEPDNVAYVLFGLPF